MKPLVAVIMGSTSDWATMKAACLVLEELEIPCEKRVISAHRTPDLMFRFAEESRTKGLKVIIAGAGGAAHLPGMVATKTTLPVIGVPVKNRTLNGVDSLLSIVQMPGGVPVATTAIGSAGATNAGLLAAEILSIYDLQLAERIQERRQLLEKAVMESGNNLNKPLKVGATIGIIGGGQLGRMLVMSGKKMGFQMIVLDPTPHSPAGQVADRQIVAAFDHPPALNELAELCDVITYEFENIEAASLEKTIPLEKLPQGTELLKITQNRLLEKTFLQSIGCKVAPFAEVKNQKELQQAAEKIGFPCVLKTIQGGYDGKGQVVLKNEQDLSQATELLANAPCELEKWLPFTKELSVIVAGNDHGYQTFPVAENIHRKNILHESIVPARISEDVQQKVAELAQHIAEELNLSGVLAIELFLTDSEELYINELAPRSHNSGHYSIEACSFSQFDAHIRGISNWGIGLPQLLQAAVMVNLLGEHLEKSYQLRTEKPTWQLHYYGKSESKVGRKMGHVTITTACLSETLKEIYTVGIWNVT